MLRRNSKLKFAGGMWVFPGGRIDEGDYPAGRDPNVAARTIRSTISAALDARPTASSMLSRRV